ncbi:Kinesin light chain 3 [Rhizophlyctis rosea]|nr:Kinesin light chain 3 [Rhizophlyctis rosea]
MLATETGSSDTPSNAEDLPLLGVRIEFFNEFMIECGSRVKFEGLTTSDVCETFIKSLTRPGESICQQRKSSSMVGTSNCFISHSWVYKFLDVVDSITAYFETNKSVAGDVFVWFDLFTLPQHGRSKLEADWLQTTFVNTISTIENVVMVLSPWYAPITFTRAWCVFELYACIKSESNFNAAFPPAEGPAYLEAIYKQPDQLAKIVGSIKSEECQATDGNDLDVIKEVIRSTVGFYTLNKKIWRTILDWTDTLPLPNPLHPELPDESGLGAIPMRLFYAEEDVMRGRLADAETVYLECWKRRSIALGDDHPDTLDCMFRLGKLYSEWGKCEEAEKFLSDCLTRRKGVLGESHRDTLATIRSLATVYWGREKGTASSYDKVERLLTECLERSGRVLGLDDTSTLDTLQALGDLYASQTGSPEKAKRLYVDHIKKMQRALGPQHLHIARPMGELAKICVANGDFAMAEGNLQCCLQIKQKELELDHPEVLGSIRQLASAYVSQRRWEDAEALLWDLVGRQCALVNIAHFESLNDAESLAGILMCQGKYEDASKIVEFCCRKRRVAGMDLMDGTLRVYAKFAESLGWVGLYDAAEMAFEICIEGRSRMLGTEDPATLQTIESLKAMGARRSDEVRRLEAAMGKVSLGGGIAKVDEGHQARTDEAKALPTSFAGVDSCVAAEARSAGVEIGKAVAETDHAEKGRISVPTAEFTFRYL